MQVAWHTVHICWAAHKNDTLFGIMESTVLSLNQYNEYKEAHIPISDDF